MVHNLIVVLEFLTFKENNEHHIYKKDAPPGNRTRVTDLANQYTNHYTFAKLIANSILAVRVCDL